MSPSIGQRTVFSVWAKSALSQSKNEDPRWADGKLGDLEQVAYDKEPEALAPAIEAASKLRHLGKEDKP
jgi:hypothetical protein